MRSPRRTAQTASALMVGLALVSAIAVFGASLSRSATSSVDNAIVADLIVTNTNNSGSGQFSNSVAQTAAAVPGVSTTTTVYADQFEFRDSLESLTAVSTPNLSDTVIFQMTSGSPARSPRATCSSTPPRPTAITSRSATPPRRGSRSTGTTPMRIGGIYQPNALIGHYLVGAAYFLSHFENPLPVAVLLRTNGSASSAERGHSRARWATPT